MGIFIAWITQNWLSALGALGIISGLFFNAYSLLVNTRVRKVDTLINITQQHRAIWLKFFDSPSLKRINREAVDLEKEPVTDDEALFVNLIILHLTTVLIAIQKKVLPKLGGLDEDIRDLFTLPIPRAIWDKTKPFRDQDTIRYIDGLLQ